MHLALGSVAGRPVFNHFSYNMFNVTAWTRGGPGPYDNEVKRSLDVTRSRRWRTTVGVGCGVQYVLIRSMDSERTILPVFGVYGKHVRVGQSTFVSVNIIESTTTLFPEASVVRKEGNAKGWPAGATTD